jgi:hypothetical protein
MKSKDENCDVWVGDEAEQTKILKSWIFVLSTFRNDGQRKRIERGSTQVFCFSVITTYEMMPPDVTQEGIIISDRIFCDYSRKGIFVPEVIGGVGCMLFSGGNGFW